MNTEPSLTVSTEPPAGFSLQAGLPHRRLLTLLNRIFSYPAALAAGLIAITALSSFTRLSDPDLWLHLKNGEIIWNTHTIPGFDIYSFTAQGHPTMAHEWLSELSLYAAYRVGGYSGLVLWVAVLGSLIYLAVYVLCWRTAGNALVAFRGGVIAFCFGSVGLGARPLLAGHLLLVLEVLVLELARTGRRRWVCLLPPIFAVWANSHGSFWLGLLVLAVYVICSSFESGFGLFRKEGGDRGFRLALGCAMPACVAAVFLNPVGLRLVLFPFDLLLLQRTAVNTVEEWLPPSLRDANTYVMLVVMGGALLLIASRRLSLRESALVFLASVLALQHRRMLFVFGLFTAPALAHYGWGTESKRAPLANGLMMCGCLAAIIWLFPSSKKLEVQIDSQYPVGAIRYLRNSHLAGPMLNEYRFGGYLIWALPETKVFIDGRAEIFDGTGILADYLRWANLSEDPEVLLDKYRIRLCLLYSGSPSAKVMPYLPGWKKVYEDAVAVIFTRDIGSLDAPAAGQF